ncbi:hypothetical protein MVEN_01830600 [Mycena venus]|uniref:EthD domain-containing protein n=1 Tax=Mycena venus TaxID=2733690 RepID=A0A8H7CNF1_9AGAR|nr:hypothetical protein MVEN_01830600 [Mycena venus]
MPRVIQLAMLLLFEFFAELFSRPAAMEYEWLASNSVGVFSNLPNRLRGRCHPVSRAYNNVLRYTLLRYCSLPTQPPAMSASVQKHSFTVIGIHKAPENLSKQEFDAKVGALCDSLVALPVARKNFLSFDAIFQNSVVDEHMKEFGWGEPQPCVVLVAEFETVQNFTEFFQDATVKKLLTDADDFAFRPASIAFSADAVTRIDVPRSDYGSTATERKLWVGIYRGPGPAFSPHITQFQENVSATMDEYVAQPVSQKNMLSHKVWMPNDSIAASLQAQGYPNAEPVVVVMIEIENWDRGIEVCEDAELKRLTEKANQNFGLHVGAICFGADVVPKIKKV